MSTAATPRAAFWASPTSAPLPPCAPIGGGARRLPPCAGVHSPPRAACCRRTSHRGALGGEGPPPRGGAPGTPSRTGHQVASPPARPAADWGRIPLRVATRRSPTSSARVLPPAANSQLGGTPRRVYVAPIADRPVVVPPTSVGMGGPLTLIATPARLLRRCGYGASRHQSVAGKGGLANRRIVAAAAAGCHRHHTACHKVVAGVGGAVGHGGVVATVDRGRCHHAS